MFKKHSGKIIVGVACLLLAGSFFWAQQASQGSDEGVVITEHVKGNPEASVILTEYSDMQCPACAAFFPVLQEVVAEYGDGLRFEYKHFPLSSIHPFATPAARASEAAGQQGKFWEMHDLLFENQSVWSNSANPQGYFMGYAEQLGLDTDQFKRQMRSNLINDKIQAEFAEARELGFTGTPSFLLNGQPMQFETFEDFVTQIEIAVRGESSASTASSTDSAEGTGSGVRFGI